MTVRLGVVAPVLQSRPVKPVPDAVSSNDPQKVVLLGVMLTVGAVVLLTTVAVAEAVQPLAPVTRTEYVPTDETTSGLTVVPVEKL